MLKRPQEVWDSYLTVIFRTYIVMNYLFWRRMETWPRRCEVLVRRRRHDIGRHQRCLHPL